LVDRGDLDGQHEPDLRAGHTGRQRTDRAAQREQAGLRRYQLVAQVLAPRRVGEVAGTEQGDALAPGPPGEAGQVEIAAAGTRVPRVDVQVGDEAGVVDVARDGDGVGHICGHDASFHGPTATRPPPRASRALVVAAPQASPLAGE